MPFAGYADFASCVSANTSKVKDPEAYCAAVKKKTEEKQHEYDSMDACMTANKDRIDAKEYCTKMVKQKSMNSMPEKNSKIKLNFSTTFETFNPENKESVSEFLVRGVA